MVTFTQTQAVQAIIGKKANDKGKEPQRITILSSELAFFADADLKSHVAAFDLFVKRLSPLYSDGQIDSVQIVLVSCGSVSSTKNDGSDEDFPTICTSTLRRKMEDLEYQPLVSTFEGKQISIERIGSSEIESLALARRWVRESICGHDHHLTLDLPETSDGSQCSVTFDISYELCPISLTSPYMNDLISDLKCIATHGLEVVQRLPLSSLDARYAIQCVSASLAHSLTRAVFCLGFLSYCRRGLMVISTNTARLKRLFQHCCAYLTTGEKPLCSL